MADGDIALETLGWIGTGEIIPDQTHMPLRMKFLPVIAGNAAGFLSPVLESVKAKGRQGGRIIQPENSEHTAFFPDAVCVRVKITGEIITHHHLSVYR